MLAVVLASLALSLTARWIFATETADSNPPAEGLSGSGQTQTERDGGSNSVDPRLSLTMLDSAEKLNTAAPAGTYFERKRNGSSRRKRRCPFQPLITTKFQPRRPTLASNSSATL